MNQLESIRLAVAEVLKPGHFFVGPHCQLEWDHAAEEQTPWEVYRGRLAPRNQSREISTFKTFNIFIVRDGERSDEPLLSLKLDVDKGQLHIVRGLLCWTWEGYDAGDNVFLSREVMRWVRELVATVDVANVEALRDELAGWVFRAVVGLSRLPLTSVESPLPGFSLGEVAYFYHAQRGDGPAMRTWRELVAHRSNAWPLPVRTKWLEFLLRATPAGDIEALASLVRTDDTFSLLRAVFNEVALSPYTDFVDKALAFSRAVGRPEEYVDFLAYLLRQLARHLTAYDLVTFHQRGANYPDALLLDAALKQFLQAIETQPELFEGQQGRLRRRGLRQGWLHRRRYEGHPVPDAPTSAGENARALPPPHVRVPEEQILNLGKRKKWLYAGDPLTNHVGPHARRILLECGRDLQQDEEVRELGMAIFIERPLGTLKAPGEPDTSPLLAHEAFSRSLAERALWEMSREPLFGLSAAKVARCREVLARPCRGIAADTLPTQPPRVVSLADAAKAAGDFVIVRTLPGSVREFCALPAIAAILADQKLEPGDCLIISSTTAVGKPGVAIHNAAGRQLFELAIEVLGELKQPC